MQPPWLLSWAPPALLPLSDLTFTGEAVPSKAQVAGMVVGDGGIEAGGAQTALVLLEGAFMQICRIQDPQPPGCVH